MLTLNIPTPWVVTVLPYTGGEPDDYGNATATYGDGLLFSVYGWAPVGADEVTTGRDVAAADLALYAPSGFRCNPRDRVRIDGLTYEVTGPMEDYGRGPFGFSPGVRVNLRRTEAT